MGVTYAMIRVSSERQSTIGHSIEQQTEELNRWGQRNAVIWGQHCHGTDAPPGFFIDAGQSAYRKRFMERPGCRKLVRALKRGDRVVVTKIDRLSRRMRDFALILDLFERMGVELVVLEPDINFSTPTGRLLAHLLMAFSEFESAMIGARAQEAKAVKAAEKQAQTEDKQAKAGQLPMAVRKEIARKRVAKLERIDSELRPIQRKAMPERLQQGGRVWIYIRCSHVDSAKSGLGLEAQLDASMRITQGIIEDDEQMAFGGVFCDKVVSAFRMNLKDRPEGSKLCEAVKPGDTVVIAKMDRGFRNTRDMLNTIEPWIAAGIKVRIADQSIDFSTWSGMVVCQALAMAAQIESSLKSCRWKETIQWLKEHGRRYNKQTGYWFKEVKVTRYLKRPNNTWRPRKVRQLAWDTDKIVMWKCVMFLHNVVGLSWYQALERTEELRAQREGRKPIALTGGFLKRGSGLKRKKDGKIALVYPATSIAALERMVKPTWEAVLEMRRQTRRSRKTRRAEPVEFSSSAIRRVAAEVRAASAPLPPELPEQAGPE